MERARALWSRLRAPQVEEMGLLQAIHGHLAPAARRTFLDFRLIAPDSVPRMAPEVEIAAFRIAQEMVGNTIRHADARTLLLTIRVQAPWLHIEARDDGRGFDVPCTLRRAREGNRSGLLGMTERARGLGGDVVILSAPLCGTTVRARLRLRP